MHINSGELHDVGDRLAQSSANDNIAAASTNAIVDYRRQAMAHFGKETLHSDEAAALAVEFKVLADPTRLQILSMLACRGVAATYPRIQEYLELAPSTIHYHMTKLIDAGLVLPVQESRGVVTYKLIRGNLAQFARLPRIG